MIFHWDILASERESREVLGHLRMAMDCTLSETK